MQTVASLAGRLDMSAEEAVETLRYLFFDIEGVDASITDEQIDVLIEINDDPKLKAKYRAERESARAREEDIAAKRIASLQKATAKKKAQAKKPAAKKPAAKAKAGAKGKKGAEAAPEAETAERKSVAELLPAEAAAVPKPSAEILPAEEAGEPGIVIGSAIEHETHRTEVIRADGSHVEPSELEIVEEVVTAPIVEERPAVAMGALARAQLDQEEETRKRGKQKAEMKPDARVVAEVIRRAHENKASGRKKIKEKLTDDGDEPVLVGPRAAVRTIAPSAPRKTGKTARKRQKKVDKNRREDDMRRSAAATLREYQSGAMDGGVAKKRRRKRAETDIEGSEEEQKQVIQVEEGMSVDAFAEVLGVDATDVILALMEQNVLATKNQALSTDLMRRVAEAYGHEIEAVIPEEEELMAEEPDDPAKLQPRAPVVTVMGHVDHGKTSLLDRVRKASVAAGEAGGITQHIAAYEVALPQGRVVFLDTPGHEAFTAMRARGAKITDVVVLVVAADDGVMPQTREAIDHARAAEVPIVVAINKCDKPGAQPDRIRQQLTEYDLLDEAWGGKTIIRNISAQTGDGIDELMELLVLETELLELKANPDKHARGAVIEAEVTRGQGPVAWVLVQSGTLRVGDIFLAGDTHGRVRAMTDPAGRPVKEAGPARPVVVMGFNAAPSAGDQFMVVKDERVARAIAEKRTHRRRMKEGPAVQHVTLEDFHRSLVAGEQTELRVVVKADVQGSVDVLKSTLPDIGNENAKIKIVHSGVGAINESDVLLASASDAVILGFHVEPTAKASHLAAGEGVSIKTYKIIYELTEDLHKSLEGLLEPEKREVITGHAEIRKVYKSSALGSIAGCMLTDGEIVRDSSARLLRKNKAIWEGKIASLRREKDQVSAVQAGFECGIKLSGFDEILEGDIIEVYKTEVVAKSLN
jgi:translation initiation factor IF-2